MARTAQPCVDGPDPCPCRVHAKIKARNRKGKGRRPVQYNHWFPRHDALLLERLARGDSPEEIAATLTDTYKVPRSGNAVKIRITRLGHSILEGWYSQTEVRRRLGISEHQARRWHEQGILPGTPYGAWLRYGVAQVEAFVREQAGLLLDPAKIRDPKLKAIAELSVAVNRRRQDRPA
jgi:hypothetical protein